MNIRIALIIFSTAFALMHAATEPIASEISLPEHLAAIRKNIGDFFLQKDKSLHHTVNFSIAMSRTVRALSWDEIKILRARVCKFFSADLGLLIQLIPHFEKEIEYRSFLEKTEAVIASAEKYFILFCTEASPLIFVIRGCEPEAYAYSARHGLHPILDIPSHLPCNSAIQKTYHDHIASARARI